MTSAPFHDLACAIHVHSTLSDGTATVAEIVAAAAECRRDVVLLTDHDTLAARRLGEERWHGPVLLLVGEEISAGRGHYLAFGTESEVDGAALGEAGVPAAVRAAGGIGFAAHPFSAGSRISRAIAPPHPWTGLEDPDICGIELWSLQTDVAEAWRGPRQALRSLLRPERALDGPPASHLRAWDELCGRRPLVGIGGLDAHQKGLRVRGRALSPMPHRRYFGLLATHVLCRRPPSGELEPDRAEVLDALGQGRCYVARDSLGDPWGFRFEAVAGSETAPMGAVVRAGRWAFRVAVPRRARLLLLRNGTPVASADGPLLEHAAEEPGAYRAEALIGTPGGDRRWIVSNPIYLR